MTAATDSTVSFLGRLRLGQKLALVVVAMSVPALLLGALYFVQAGAGISQTRSELSGTRYLRALGSVSAEILTHRGREYAFLSGDKTRRQDVISQEAEVDKQFIAADTVDAQLGAQFGVSADLQSLKSQWAALKSTGLQQAAEENDAAHLALAAHFARVAEKVGARSLTFVDPEMTTRSLVRVASDYAPALMIYGANMRRHAVHASSKGYLGGDDRVGIKVFRDHQLALLDTMNDALEHVPPDSKASLQAVADSAKAAADDFFTIVRAKVLDAASMEVSGGAIYDAGVPTNRALKKLSLAGYETLNTALEQRLSRLTRQRALTAGVTLLALALALTLSWLITRALADPMRHAVSVFGGIASGSYDNSVTAHGTDEAAQVLRALDQMQGKLRTQLEEERAVAAENARIRQALDKASTNVVLADANHEIIYVNETAQATFARGQSEIARTLQGFNSQRLHGSNLDALSPDPSGEHRTLDALKGSDVQERKLGALTFRTVSNPVVGDHGERIGTIVEWTDRTEEIGVEKEMQAMLSAVVGGELTRRIALAGKTGFFEAASRGVNQLADNMAEMVALVKEASGEIYRGATEIASGNTNLQQRTEEQSASLEETASSMEQMTTTVKQNADNAGHANQLAVAARDQADKGGTVVGKAVVAMSNINESARKIANIIGVIDEIAFQTNLLALNAAVEAARAGELGRGFAVVATEVRTLAGRSATAAKEIKELIQDSVRKVADGSALVTRSGQTLEQIVASVKKVSDIVAEIAAASREQSAGIGQVNSAVLQMDELTQQNATLVEQATNASQAMAYEAQALHEMMGGYRLGDPVADTAQEAKPAAQVERRSSSRPWGGNSGSKRATATVPGSPVVVDAAHGDGDGDGDGEWHEF